MDEDVHADGKGSNPFFAEAAAPSNSSRMANANLKRGDTNSNHQGHYFEAETVEAMPNPFFDSLQTGSSASSRSAFTQNAGRKGNSRSRSSQEEEQNPFFSMPASSSTGQMSEALHHVRGASGLAPSGWGGDRGGRHSERRGRGGGRQGGRDSQAAAQGPPPVAVVPVQQEGPSVLERLAEKKAVEDAARQTKREAARQRRQNEQSEAEHRWDPADGQSCTYNDICRKYRNTYSQKDIDSYWARECR